MLVFLVGEAMRDLKRGGRITLSAVLLIALSLVTVGCFWLLSLNLGRAVGQWRDRVRVVAYLRGEPPAGQVDDLLRKIEAVGGVQRLRFIDKAEALESLRQSMGAQADVIDSLPRNPLPASVEVTPDAPTATPEGTRALVERLAELPEIDEVQGGAEWVESLARWQRLFQLIGLAAGGLLALAAILSVTTAATLVLHLRRDEMEIMRLVGATESTIRLPLLFQGLAQGLMGAVVALAALELMFFFVAPRLEPLLNLTLGLGRAVFLSLPEMVAMLGGGALLGAMGGFLAKARSE
ncbi:MAG: ABC transporter permease [Candidatus Rokubacteria bacterium]|nr:ABC transporter permease [Candidatus Rokubacteria bacterium]